MPAAAAMAGPGLWSSIKSALRRSEPPLFLNDSSAFDFSDEAGDEDFPRFNKLRVVVADDAAEAAPEAPANGLHPAPPSDDESVAERDIALRGGPEPCGRCRSRRELCKLRRVKKRLTAAAVLYLLFMTGELVGESGAALASVLRVCGESRLEIGAISDKPRGERERSPAVLSVQGKKGELAASLPGAHHLPRTARSGHFVGSQLFIAPVL